jgi:hypothetical protein
MNINIYWLIFLFYPINNFQFQPKFVIKKNCEMWSKSKYLS